MTMHSFGNYPKIEAFEYWPVYWSNNEIPFYKTNKDFLCYAYGKSYGDSCLNENGILLATRHMNRFIAFDNVNGILRAESGITFAEILRFIVPYGWFLPVVPGTKYISLGGAIANDIHGKNHHHMGTIGRYVTCFELLCSDGNRLYCSPEDNFELFAATIGGLGLTGMITWVEIKLIPISSPYLCVEKTKFSNLDEFFELSQASENEFAYTVSWLDCLSAASGRGIFMRANHTDIQISQNTNHKIITIPCYFPNFILNKMTLTLFNALYYSKQLKKVIKNILHYDRFFFQLDAFSNWNRMYGKRGFLQYQCILPNDAIVLKSFIKKIQQSGQGSFLSVLILFPPK